MRNLTSLLIAGAALASASLPAAAQWYGSSYRYNAPAPPYGYGGPSYARPLPRGVIVERLEDRGFEEVGRPRLEEDVYVVEATSRRGAAVRVVVDAYDGRILQQTPLSVARLSPLEDDFDGYAGPRRGGLPPEMPNAPRWRPGEPEPLPREAGRPAEPDIVAPAPGPLGRPSDPRLAPSEEPSAAGRGASPEPRREANRPVNPDAALPPGEVQGLNPDGRRGTRPAAKPPGEETAAKPDKPTDRPVPPPARTSPAAPAPSTAARPDEPKPVTPGPNTAQAGERKPVRVIEGVTPLNSGQQSTPAPQNNVETGQKATGQKP